MVVILLNMISGIIIDTFGAIRTKKQEIENDIKQKCFICGIEASVFDHYGDDEGGFKAHISSAHNIWQYVYFLIYLREKDEIEYNGTESYVRHCLNKNDTNFLPINQAIVLTDYKLRQTRAEAELHKFVNETHKIVKEIEKKMEKFQTTISQEK
eukprot:c16810_g1_i1.p1 GENE.c16810_g1_i1~~c16810_g1_i1.p1  ORF type:complete len:154 (-),score=45.46 c16810_g1_i1:12-473(-)